MFNEINNISLIDFRKKYGNIYRTLLRTLQENNSWERLFDILRSLNILCSDEQLYNVKSSSSPSMVLLYELENRFATVEHLQHLLRQSKLWNPLALISDPEPLKIVIQPGKEDQEFTLEDGTDFVLECCGEGLPYPTYQWYFGNLELPGQINPSLTIPDFGSENCGEYYCVLSHVIEDKTISLESNHVFAELMPIPPSFEENGDLPTQRIINAGLPFKIGVTVQGRPFPSFVWVKNNTVLDGQNYNALMFDSIQPDDQGEYKCFIRNKAGDLTSSTCTVEIILGPEQSFPKNAASHKIALLIGNSAYDSSVGILKTPSEDVVLIAQQLKCLDFHVIALQNLTSVEMRGVIRWFYRILPTNAYAFFYYVGHGFMTSRYKYMMPVDATESCQLSDCYADEKLIKKIMSTKIKLFFMVLDMCLKIPDRFKKSGIENEEKTITYRRNPGITLIRLNSTSDHMRAYESAGCVNALYAKCLAKHLTRDYPATYISTLVQEEFIRCSRQKVQIPNMNSDDGERLKLTDPTPVYGYLTDTDIEMKKLNFLNDREELKFERVNVNTYVTLSFHKCFFQNALDIFFPDELCRSWYITAEINHENLNNNEWHENETGQKVLTIYDLQKAVSSICLTIKLNHIRYNNAESSWVLELVDHCAIDFDYLGIVDKKIGVTTKYTES